jgi:hypothetical protein
MPFLRLLRRIINVAYILQIIEYRTESKYSIWIAPSGGMPSCVNTTGWEEYNMVKPQITTLGM